MLRFAACPQHTSTHPMYFFTFGDAHLCLRWIGADLAPRYYLRATK
jgi:hypothetical protein